MKKTEKHEKIKKSFIFGGEMTVSQSGILFFDSGIGGLTVLAECRKHLKTENFYYYGDNQRAPYGNLPADVIKKYTQEAFDEANGLSIKAAVVACNTATAVCVEELRKRYAFPVIGTEPAVALAAKNTMGDIFILTTKATHDSARFGYLCERISKEYPNVHLYPRVCDALAGEIEKSAGKSDFDCAPYLPQGNPDAVVLGCTHYIYIKEKIRAHYGCSCYDGNAGIAARLQKILFSQNPVTIFEENWEKKPPRQNFSIYLGGLTTNDPLQTKGNNANKCSWSNAPNYDKKEGKIVFLGSGKIHNKEVYKQTFGF